RAGHRGQRGIRGVAARARRLRSGAAVPGDDGRVPRPVPHHVAPRVAGRDRADARALRALALPRREVDLVGDDRAEFDRLSAGILAGRGVVARYPGVVCVADAAGAEPVRALVALCAAVAGFEPGRPLARRLAAWLSGPDAPPPHLRFGTLADAGDRWAVFLSGAVSLHDAGTDTTIPGAEAAAWTDRLVTPGGPLVLLLDALGEDRPQGCADDLFADLHDLRAGTVPGRGVVLATASAARHTAMPPLPPPASAAPPSPPAAAAAPAAPPLPVDLGRGKAPVHAEPTHGRPVPDEEPIEVTVGDGSGPPPIPPVPRAEEPPVRPPRRSALIDKAPAP